MAGSGTNGSDDNRKVLAASAVVVAFLVAPLPLIAAVASAASACISTKSWESACVGGAYTLLSALAMKYLESEMPAVALAGATFVIALLTEVSHNAKDARNAKDIAAISAASTVFEATMAAVLLVTSLVYGSGWLAVSVGLATSMKVRRSESPDESAFVAFAYVSLGVALLALAASAMHHMVIVTVAVAIAAKVYISQETEEQKKHVASLLLAACCLASMAVADIATITWAVTAAAAAVALSSPAMNLEDTLGRAKQRTVHKDKNGRTQLHLAAISNNLALVTMLLQTEDGDEAKATKDNSGMTPLHLAAREGHSRVAEQLLKGREHSMEEDKNGNTPLHLAAERGHKEVAELLLKKEAQRKALSKGNNFGLTPLHLAAGNGQGAVVKPLLLAREGQAAKKLKDDLGRTPRDLAVGLEQIMDMFDLCSAMSASILEDDLTCPICYEIYSSSDEARRPVVVCQNGHSMCRECMGRSGKAGRGTCPECNEPMVSSPVVNRALCNVIEAFEEA